MEDTLLTLEGEKMYVESIHREVFQGEEYLYWFFIQGPGGIDVRESESYIDIKHLEYWEECIDKSFGKVDIPAQVIMIPHKVREIMRD